MMAWFYFDLASIFVCLFVLLLSFFLLLTMTHTIAQIFSTQVNIFLKEYTRIRKLLKKKRKNRKSQKSKKRSKIEEETTVETEAKRLKVLNLEQRSFKLSPKSTLTDPAQKTLVEDPKWLLQTDSKILPGPKPKTCSKAPPTLLPTLLGPPVKRKGPGRQ